MTNNQINPRKLLHSKWSACSPKNRELHFMVTRVRYDEQRQVELCELEAVLTRRLMAIDWRALKDGKLWKPGWVR